MQNWQHEEVTTTPGPVISETRKSTAVSQSARTTVDAHGRRDRGPRLVHNTTHKAKMLQRATSRLAVLARRAPPPRFDARALMTTKISRAAARDKRRVNGPKRSAKSNSRNGPARRLALPGGAIGLRARDGPGPRHAAGPSWTIRAAGRGHGTSRVSRAGKYQGLTDYLSLQFAGPRGDVSRVERPFGTPDSSGDPPAPRRRRRADGGLAAASAPR